MLNDNDYFSMVLDVLKDNSTSYDVSKALCSKVFEKIGSNLRPGDVVDTQEICDDVLNCFNYYNDFVISKKINVALIEESEYDNVVLGINFAVEVLKGGE